MMKRVFTTNMFKNCIIFIVKKRYDIVVDKTKGIYNPVKINTSIDTGEDRESQQNQPEQQNSCQFSCYQVLNIDKTIRRDGSVANV